MRDLWLGDIYLLGLNLHVVGVLKGAFINIVCDMKYSLTVFTPTYNRGYILSSLKESLLRQDRYDFEWLIIDDGSIDNTENCVIEWMKEDLPFDIHYYKTENGGKPRAINRACELALSEWLFMIDSDDYLVDNIISFLENAINTIEHDETFVGVGVLRGDKRNKAFGQVSFNDYVDATNLQREEYGLNFDCNEVYRIKTLKKYPFYVWPGEKFIPEEVILNELSLQGYRLRWYNKIGVISEYLPDGMTKGAWKLIRKNPMGYAMMYNHKLKYTKKISLRVNYVCQFIAYCFIAGQINYLRKCNSKLIIPLLPLGVILFIRRSLQLHEVL